MSFLDREAFPTLAEINGRVYCLHSRYQDARTPEPETNILKPALKPETRETASAVADSRDSRQLDASGVIGFPFQSD